MKICKDDKQTHLGFFYLRRKGWTFGELKCSVWTGPKGVIVWDGSKWGMYSDFEHDTVIDYRISGS